MGLIVLDSACGIKVKESQVQAAYLQFDGDFPDQALFALMVEPINEGVKR